MARIRTIKPAFFRHERLQDLEAANPGKHVMLVFAGLWGHCDKAGHFRWQPRTLKLDILPFLEFDMTLTLEVLEKDGLIQRYVVDGVEYGCVPTFAEHQRVSGKEAQEPAQFPEPNSEKPAKRQRQIREAIEKHPGEQEQERSTGREGKGDARYARVILEKDFELWYSAYPRHEARADALKAYLKARETVDSETLLAGSKAYAAKPDRDPKFTKLPATWLNKGCWLDEAAKLETAPTADPEAAWAWKAKIVIKRMTNLPKVMGPEILELCRRELITEAEARAYGWVPDEELTDIPAFLKRTA